MMETAGKVRINSEAKFSNGFLHMDTPVLADPKQTYICLDAALRTCQRDD